MGWTEARKETLRTMWLAGESAKRISEALGEVSRNAVMGKVHRMGLMGSAEHNARITGRIFGACRPIMPAEAIDVAPGPVTVEIVDVVPREAPVGQLVGSADGVGIGFSEDSPVGRPAIPLEADAGAEEAITAEIVAEDQVNDDEGDPGADPDEEVGNEDEDEDVADDEEGDEEGADAVGSIFDDPDALAEEDDDEEDAEPRRRYPSIRRVDADLPAVAVAPEVVRLVGGVIATAHEGTERGVIPDWRQAVSVVSRLTGQDYDVKRPGHRGAIVAVATILAGDPRRILCPRMGEPEVLRMMRGLATGGMIVGGKAPERWRDPVDGDASFFDDMLTVEETKDRWRIRIERTAPVEDVAMPIAA